MALTPAQEALVRRVLRKVDADDSGAGSVVSYDEVYRGLQRAVRATVKEAPGYTLFDAVTNLTTDADSNVYQLGSDAYSVRFGIPLPSDYLRLIKLKVTGWTAHVDRTTEAEGNFYRDAVRNGVGATTNRPEVFLAYNDNSAVTDYTAGNRSLEVMPGTDATAKVTEFLYIPEIVPETFVTTCPDLDDAVLYYAAYWTFLAIDPELSAVCFNRYREHLMIESPKQKTTFTRRLHVM